MKTVQLAALMTTAVLLVIAPVGEAQAADVPPGGDDPTVLPELVESQVNPYIARGDQLAAEGKFGAARREYKSAAEIVREAGKLPAHAMRRIANSFYYEERFQSAGKVLLDLADEAASFGDVVTQVWATADAAWVAAAAGDKIDVERRVASLERLLDSPYLPDEVRSEVTSKRLALEGRTRTLTATAGSR